MASTFNGNAMQRSGHYARRMSTHLAAALVFFTLLQIFVIVGMGGSLVLHLGIMVAIAGYALVARRLERRWQFLDGSGLSDHGLATRFRRDLLQLWAGSLFGALLWVPIAIIFRALFG